MSLPLVLGAGLFVRTLINLQHQPLGFDPEQILTFTVDPSKAGMKDAPLLAAHARIQDRLRAMPGVRGVTMSRLALITGWVSNSPASLDGDTPATNPQTRRIHWNQVGPDFFETLGMSLLIGRGIDARDTATGPQVAVVNEAMAKQLFPGQYPVGKRFWLGRNRSGAPMEIVGVVRDAKYASLRAPAPPTAYLPYTQGRTPLSSMCYEVRAEGDPMALVSGIRHAVSDIVPGVPIGDVKTQARLIDDSLGQETMYVRLFAFFGLCGAAARLRWPVRHDVVRARPSHAGDRHQDGAGGRASPRARVGAGGGAGHRRRGGVGRRLPGLGRSALRAESALRGDAARSPDDRGRGRNHADGRGWCRLTSPPGGRRASSRSRRCGKSRVRARRVGSACAMSVRAALQWRLGGPEAVPD